MQLAWGGLRFWCQSPAEEKPLTSAGDDGPDFYVVIGKASNLTREIDPATIPVMTNTKVNTF